LFEARNRLREIFVKGKDSYDIEYFCPIKIERLVDKIRSHKDQKSQEVVDPVFVY